MALYINSGLAAFELLKNDGYIVHPLEALPNNYRRILIINLMPTKEVTEYQLLSRLTTKNSSSPFQDDKRSTRVDFLRMRTYQSRHVSADYLQQNYIDFEEAQQSNYDALIVTGAPVEHMPFEDVAYWQELTQIFDYYRSVPTLFICWAAQAALYYRYGLNKVGLPHKLFGVYEHRIINQDLILNGIDSGFMAPHSRHTTVEESAILAQPSLKVLARSDKVGAYLVKDLRQPHFYVMGHSEYQADTLYKEYMRDKAKGLPIQCPDNYFLNDNPQEEILHTWQTASERFFYNFINYYADSH